MDKFRGIRRRPHVYSLVLTLLFLPALYACQGNPSDSRARAAVEAALAPGESLGATQTADLYGGKAVLHEDQRGAIDADAYVPSWWVRDDGRAFTLNGLARNVTPGLPFAPVSVNEKKAYAAYAGEKFPLPKHLGVTCEAFIARMDELTGHTEARDSLHFVYWSVPGFLEVDGLVGFTEVGGYVVEVEGSFYAAKLDDRAATLAFNRAGIEAGLRAVQAVAGDVEVAKNILYSLSKALSDRAEDACQVSATHEGVEYRLARQRLRSATPERLEHYGSTLKMRIRAGEAAESELAKLPPPEQVTHFELKILPQP